MVRFIVEAKSKDCPWFPSVLFLPVPLWKESSLVFIKPRNRASVQTLCHWFSPCLCPIPATLVSAPNCTAAGAAADAALLYPGLFLEAALGDHIAARTTWLLWRENARMNGVNACCWVRYRDRNTPREGRGWGRGRECALLSLAYIILGLGKSV